MTAAASDLPSEWLTELDDIELSWNMTAFCRSHLGRLPLELLEIIVHHVPTTDLPAIARVTPQLRQQAEQSLYTHIDLTARRVAAWTEYKDTLWPLYRTLLDRTDLAQRVKEFAVTLSSQDIAIDVATSPLFPGDEPLSSATKVFLRQIFLGGRIILHHLTNVEQVRVTLGLSTSRDNGWESFETVRYKNLAPHPLKDLLPAFDSTTAHQLQYPGLRNLTFLEFAGAEFHWSLAKPPRIQKLHLTRPCVILCDEAPDEVNPSITSFSVTARSTILKEDSHHYANFASFLDHLPSLENLKVRIYDLRVDELPYTPASSLEEEELSYTTLLQRLIPVAAHLTSLDVGVYDDHEDDDQVANDFLREVQPASGGFQRFTALETLVVPYQCLLGRTISTVDTLPSPAAILPPTLVSLKVDCPQIHFYDWLTRLGIVYDQLPALSEVELYCQSPHGDDWPEFNFANSDHRALQVFYDVGVDLWLTFRERDWQLEWGEYDLNIFDVIDWVESLGGEHVEGCCDLET